MIAKTLFLPKTLYRYGAQFFRDHGSWSAEYSGGYLCEGARLFRMRGGRDYPRLHVMCSSFLALAQVITTSVGVGPQMPANSCVSLSP